MKEQDKIRMLDYAYDYLIGALWWGAEYFIQERFNPWHPAKTGKERKCHPLLSCREERVTGLADTIVMLAGSSVKSPSDEKGNFIVRMDESQPQKKTAFFREIESQLITAGDFLYHKETEKINDDPETPLWERRRLWPNFVKTRITRNENALLKAFLDRREKVAQENGGCNYD